MSPAEDNDCFTQDIFCCILNTLFKSKIWAKIDELVFRPFGINAAHFVGSSIRIFDNIIAE